MLQFVVSGFWHISMSCSLASMAGAYSMAVKAGKTHLVMCSEVFSQLKQSLAALLLVHRSHVIALAPSAAID